MFNTIQFENLPEKLKCIANPPKCLYYLGDISLLEFDSIAVVGTRTPSVYGKKQAQIFASSLALGGVTIVSGLARGIDGIAHKAALESGGTTIAVLGCGIDEVYPPEHKDLYREIARKGLIISEYPPGTAALPKLFPQRNRIVSALARAILIPECGKKSGTMTTVAAAKLQGKDIYTIPTNLDNVHGDGNIALIKSGSKIVTSPKDLLLNKKNGRMISVQAPKQLTYFQDKILNMIQISVPITADKISLELYIPIAVVNYELLSLEFMGMITKTGNGYLLKQ